MQLNLSHCCRRVAWDEKSEKKNDRDGVDGMRLEDYSKGKEMLNEMSDL